MPIGELIFAPKTTFESFRKEASKVTAHGNVYDPLLSNILRYMGDYSRDPVRSMESIMRNIGVLEKLDTTSDAVHFDRSSILDRLQDENSFLNLPGIRNLPLGDSARALGNVLQDELARTNPEDLMSPQGRKKVMDRIKKGVEREFKERGKSFARGVVQIGKDVTRGAINAILRGDFTLSDTNLLITDSRLSYAYNKAEINTKFHKKSIKGEGSDAKPSDKPMLGVTSVINNWEVFRLNRVNTTSGDDVITDYLMLDKEGFRNYTSEESINPTTGAIIQRYSAVINNPTPYKAADFLWLKYYNKIPNTQLVTLRRYFYPIDDKFRKTHLLEQKTKVDGWGVEPVAQMLTYYGGNSGNSLSDILSLAWSMGWKQVTNTPNIRNIENIPSIAFPDLGNILDKFLNNTDIGRASKSATSAAAGVLSKSASVLPGISKLNDVMSSLTKKFPKMSGSTLQDYQKSIIDYALMGMGYGDPTRIGSPALKNEISTYNPYKSGNSLDDRVVGPVNFVEGSHIRDRGLLGGLNTFTLNFEYSLKSIGHINAKVAMLDILSNVMACTFNHGNFWGGSYNFFITSDGKYPLGSIRYIQLLYEGKTQEASKELLETVSKAMESGNVTKTLDAVTQMINNGNVNSTDDSHSSMANIETSLLSKLKEGLTVGLGDFGSLDNNGSKFLEYNSAQLFGALGVSNFKPEIHALRTGAPSGYWHLTVGNPFNPIARIGNLICTNATAKFNDIIGPDDFPTELKVTVQLKQSTDRDSSYIQSIFNDGFGRLYYPGNPKNGKSVRDTTPTTEEIKDANESQFGKIMGAIGDTGKKVLNAVNNISSANGSTTGMLSTQIDLNVPTATVASADSGKKVIDSVGAFG